MVAKPGVQVLHALREFGWRWFDKTGCGAQSRAHHFEGVEQPLAVVAALGFDLRHAAPLDLGLDLGQPFLPLDGALGGK